VLEVKLNENPPAVHSGFKGVDGSKTQGAVNVAALPVTKKSPKAPSAFSTFVLLHAVTESAVAGLPVSNVTDPLKLTLPSMGIAQAFVAHATAANRTISFFIV